MHSGVITAVPTDEDLALIVAARNESDAAWREARDACSQLYERHARRLLAFLSARVQGSDLEDIHQGVWERVWNRLPEGFRGGNFRAWLYQVSRNYLHDHHRKKKPERLEDETRLSGDANGNPESLAMQKERMDILAACLEKLDEQSASLVRARLAGESYEDICGRLSIQAARAHKLFHFAKAQLQDCVNHGSP